MYIVCKEAIGAIPLARSRSVASIHDPSLPVRTAARFGRL